MVITMFHYYILLFFQQIPNKKKVNERKGNMFLIPIRKVTNTVED